MPHSHDQTLLEQGKKCPSPIPSRETSNTGPTYAPSKHTKCAKTQKLTEKSNNYKCIRAGPSNIISYNLLTTVVLFENMASYDAILI